MWEDSFYELSVAAARQQGLITSAQANRLGVNDEALAHLNGAGLLSRIGWSVYQVASSALGPRHSYPYAAWLALAPDTFRWERPGSPSKDAVLSHESACVLHGLGTLSSQFEVFTVPEEHETPRGIKAHVAALSDDEITKSESVPVTTPHRTVLDLVTNWTQIDDVRDVIADAVRRDLVDLQAIHDDLTPLADEYDFPIGGPHFIGYFMANVDPDSLSQRNLRAYAVLAFGERVAEVKSEISQVVTSLRQTSGRVPTPDADELLSRRVAAEIVGQIRPSQASSFGSS